MIRAAIVADSLSPIGARLTTFEVTCHRFILAEFNTHRVFSRNSASSRAIPVTKTIARVADDPAFPEVWASEQKGMQGGSPLDGSDLFEAQRLFRDVHHYTVQRVNTYLDHHPITEDGQQRLHKSLVNRLLEPFMWHTIIVTSSEWDNFWVQRCSPLAQPEMRLLAEAMKSAYDASTPQRLVWGQWHLPYIDSEDWTAIAALAATTEAREALARKISAARCARVSYLTHDGRRDITEDIRMFDQTLMAADPKHWSPLEHIATPMRQTGRGYGTMPGQSISGWEWSAIEAGAAEGLCRVELDLPWGIVLRQDLDRLNDRIDLPLAHTVIPGNFAPSFLQFRHAVGLLA